MRSKGDRRDTPASQSQRNNGSTPRSPPTQATPHPATPNHGPIYTNTHPKSPPPRSLRPVDSAQTPTSGPQVGVDHETPRDQASAGGESTPRDRAPRRSGESTSATEPQAGAAKAPPRLSAPPGRRRGLEVPNGQMGLVRLRPGRSRPDLWRRRSSVVIVGGKCPTGGPQSSNDLGEDHQWHGSSGWCYCWYRCGCGRRRPGCSGRPATTQASRRRG
jgi:hypothetical protein